MNYFACFWMLTIGSSLWGASPLIDAAEISLDYLFWQANEPGLTFAVPQNSLGKIENPHSCAQSGFKVGAGLYGESLDQKFDILYTWFKSSSDWQKIGPSLAVWNDFLDTSLVQQGEQKWLVNLQELDVMLKSRFWQGQSLQMTLGMGLKGALLSQELQYSYVTSTLFSSSRKKISFEGAGLSFFWDMEWCLYSPFSLEGSLILSSLYGEQKITSYTKQASEDSIFSSSVIENNANILYQLVPITECSLYLVYKTNYIGNNPYRFTLKIGFEEQLFSSMNLFNRTAERGAKGSLSFQGLTIQTSLIF